MVQWIRRREEREAVEYRLFFAREEGGDCGFAFDCDEHGLVDLAGLAPTAIETLFQLAEGTIKAQEPYVYKSERVWMEPGVFRCPCGGEVEAGGFTNTCDGCGADYNWAGQRLAPREQWGEETGEHYTDILRIR